MTSTGVKPYRVLFMGTPEFAVPSLQGLLDSEEVVCVVTNPDRPAGRGRKPRPSPVKELALDAGITVIEPTRLRSPKAVEQVSEFKPDLIVVAAYGKLLPKSVLDLPAFGCINVHASLLPAYRGAAPIQWAIIRGEKVSGITIMQMDEGMDTGPILLQREERIEADDTSKSLSERLSMLGKELLLEAVLLLKEGRLVPRPQPESGASLAPMLRKEDGRVSWDKPSSQVANLIQGADPWPGAFSFLSGQVLKLFHGSPCPGSGAPGTVLGLDKEGLWVACGQGAVIVAELQLPGRRRMEARALCAGRPIPSGTLLQ